jgi:hypothetical protein
MAIIACSNRSFFARRTQPALRETRSSLLHGSSGCLGTEWQNPPGKGANFVGLNPQTTGTSKVTNEAFPGKKQRLVTTDSTDGILERGGECNDVPGIHSALAFDVERDHAAVGVKPQVARAGAFDEKQGFTGKKPFKTPCHWLSSCTLGLEAT